MDVGFRFDLVQFINHIHDLVGLGAAKTRADQLVHFFHDFSEMVARIDTPRREIH